VTTSEYPKYWLRIEVLGAPWHEVDSATYLRAETRWSASRDAADHSRFWCNGVEGMVQWTRPRTEKDVISGAY
jgi:hypothetical protein